MTDELANSSYFPQSGDEMAGIIFGLYALACCMPFFILIGAFFVERYKAAGSAFVWGAARWTSGAVIAFSLVYLLTVGLNATHPS